MSISKAALAAVGLAFVTACGDAAPRAASTTGTSAAVPAAKTGCYGSGHVRVEPCPITIRGKRGTIAGVRGPGVVKAFLYQTCDGGICSVKPHGGVTFKVKGGANCGGPAEISFEAWDAQNQAVGYGYAAVTNDFCP
ncbi:MAG TPA: hypothetical protein VFE16_05215 [Candidatus Cybelea sp.]|jgi:hypothetical protein|nr:hypothetical protein [Candidatus Cybelea sp.]